MAHIDRINEGLQRISHELEFISKTFARLKVNAGCATCIDDLVTDLKQLDNGIFRFCNALAQLHALGCTRIPDPIRNLMVPVDLSDLLVVSTPYLHRRKYPTGENHCVVSPLLEHALGQAPLAMRDQVAAVSVDVLTVYPPDTNPTYMIDPDNINAKRVIDLSTIALGIDDNGAITTLTIDAVRSARLAAGTYTFIRPRPPRNDDEHPILRVIEEALNNEHAKRN